MSERIKITIHKSHKWSLIINDDGELWIAKDESIFNPLDPHWTYQDIEHAESFCHYLRDKVVPDMAGLEEDFAEMTRDMNQMIFKRFNNDKIAAEEA